MESAVALPRGFELNEYRIESTLGIGGFGLTYLATDANLNRKVAIKEYLPGELAQRGADHSVSVRSDAALESFNWGRTRFLDEARTLGSFHHPNIVRVMRFFEANLTAYMVMEFVAGEALSEWIGTRRPIPQARALSMALALLDGLEVVHNAGYLHRDIKPANIYVRDDESPVLLDFGSARAARNTELTAIITPGYAPLEQYHGGGNQGPWSDIYSVGAVLYWMVVGVKPVEAVARARSDALAPAVRAGDQARYSPEFLKAIDWALAPGEEMRPQSVAQLREVLSRVAPVAGSDAPTVIGGPLPPPYANPAQPVSGHSQNPSQNLTSLVSVVDPETRARIEAALAQHIGPIAAVTFRRAAKRAASPAELIEMLADEIDGDEARAAFVKQCASIGKAAERERSLLVRSNTGAPVAAAHPPSAPASQPPSGPARAASPPLSAPPDTQSRPPSQPLSRPRLQPLEGGQPSRLLDLTPAALAAAEEAIEKYNGAISKAIVRRAAARSRDETEFYLIVADSIEDPVERRSYLRKMLPASPRR